MARLWRILKTVLLGVFRRKRHAAEPPDPDGGKSTEPKPEARHSSWVSWAPPAKGPGVVLSPLATKAKRRVREKRTVESRIRRAVHEYEQGGWADRDRGHADPARWETGAARLAEHVEVLLPRDGLLQGRATRILDQIRRSRIDPPELPDWRPAPAAVLAPLTTAERGGVTRPRDPRGRLEAAIHVYLQRPWRKSDRGDWSRGLWIQGLNALCDAGIAGSVAAKDRRQLDECLEELARKEVPGPPTPPPPPPRTEVPAAVRHHLKLRGAAIPELYESIDEMIVDVLATLGFDHRAPVIGLDSSESFVEAFESMEQLVDSAISRGVHHRTIEHYQKSRGRYDEMIESSLSEWRYTDAGQWKELGPLRFMGYSVGKDLNLPAERRRMVLRFLIRSRLGFLRRIDRELHAQAGRARTRKRIRWVESYLVSFIALRRNQSRYRDAVARWEDDLGWLRSQLESAETRA